MSASSDRPASPSPAAVRANAEAMMAEDAASQALGIRIDEIVPGRCVMSMAVSERMVNGHKVCHGGYIFLLADTAMAFASNSHGPNALAQHCAVTYIRPGLLGDRLTATAIERSRQGRSGLYDVTVTRAGGEVVAEFRGATRTIKGSWAERS